MRLQTPKFITKPTPRGRTWWQALALILLGLAALVIVLPRAWNQTSDALQQIAGRRLIPHMKPVPFRLGLDLLGGTHLLYEADVSSVPAGDRDEALEGVRDVIERRVNAFGVAEPVVQTTRAGDHWRIIVELAGIKDVAEAKKQIGETPVLEFRLESEEAARPPTPEEVKLAEEKNAEARKKAEELLKKVQAPLANFTIIAKENSEDPGSKEKGGELGFIRRGQGWGEAFDAAAFDPSFKTGIVYPKLVESEFGLHILRKIGDRTMTEEGKEVYEVEIQHILIRIIKPEDLVPRDQWRPTGLGGKQLRRAIAAFDQNTGEPEVSLEFNDEGRELFAQITRENVGKLVAIFLDGLPISIPRVNEPITGGRAVVSGNFTVNEAKLLAQRLNAGALPLPIKIVSEQTVGPTLGKISLQKSLQAGLWGFLLVALYMILYYRLPGLISVLALAFYASVVLALFKLIPVTLTLSGIAGFILTLGMAVDANVLIFERLKEEIRAGRGIQNAIDEGFRRAWSSIRDGNLTTILTAIIMFAFASSVIKGFALTLGIGVVISMFSAITITRVFLRLAAGWVQNNWWYGVRSEIK